MTAILNEDPPQLAEPNATIPPGLERVVRRCIEKRPEERFQSATGHRLRPGGGVGGISHPAMFSASADVLAAVSSPIPSGSRLASSGRNGEDLRLWEERESPFWPRLSPDGRRLALHLLGHTPALWVEDLERGTRVRVATVGLLPAWSPDGTRLAYVTGTRFKPHSASSRQTAPAGSPCGPAPAPTAYRPTGRRTARA